ncbi:MAG: hypothetical protein WAK60_08200 [Sedimentisphaerales bacterium]
MDIQTLRLFNCEFVTIELIEEIRDASQRFSRDTTVRARAYETLMTDPNHKEILSRVRNGKDVLPEDIGNSLVRFLNYWGCRFPYNSIPALIPALKLTADQIMTSIGNMSLEMLQGNHLGCIVSVFETLCEVPHVGGTTASKILSVIQPKTFMMWDAKIANAYGFSQNEMGYFRFLMFTRNIIRKLREFEPPPIEMQLCIENQSRGWEVPIAKILDEWNWKTVL